MIPVLAPKPIETNPVPEPCQLKIQNVFSQSDLIPLNFPAVNTTLNELTKSCTNNTISSETIVNSSETITNSSETVAKSISTDVIPTRTATRAPPKLYPISLLKTRTSTLFRREPVKIISIKPRESTLRLEPAKILPMLPQVVSVPTIAENVPQKIIPEQPNAVLNTTIAGESLNKTLPVQPAPRPTIVRTVHRKTLSAKLNIESCSKPTGANRSIIKIFDMSKNCAVKPGTIVAQSQNNLKQLISQNLSSQLKITRINTKQSPNNITNTSHTASASALTSLPLITSVTSKFNGNINILNKNVSKETPLTIANPIVNNILKLDKEKDKNIKEKIVIEANENEEKQENGKTETIETIDLSDDEPALVPTHAKSIDNKLPLYPKKKCFIFCEDNKSLGKIPAEVVSEKIILKILHCKEVELPMYNSAVNSFMNK